MGVVDRSDLKVLSGYASVINMAPWHHRHHHHHQQQQQSLVTEIIESTRLHAAPSDT